MDPENKVAFAASTEQFSKSVLMLQGLSKLFFLVQQVLMEYNETKTLK